MDISSMLSPFLEQFLIGLFAFLAAILSLIFNQLRTKIFKRIDTVNNIHFQELLRTFALQAFAQVENTMKAGETGAEKLEKAIEIVTNQLEQHGFKDIKKDNIISAIEEAVLKFNYAYSN
ncbi:phage holin [Shouchella clausii]|uniref:phage holin n=1 Tax=Shouchella clausii TaxID=79880 RepID=UPI002DC00410|nr:phage holin [Shouchella clausii]MEB5480764.1 phage holin [Shouchella clausii]